MTLFNSRCLWNSFVTSHNYFLFFSDNVISTLKTTGLLEEKEYNFYVTLDGAVTQAINVSDKSNNKVALVTEVCWSFVFKHPLPITCGVQASNILVKCISSVCRVLSFKSCMCLRAFDIIWFFQLKTWDHIFMIGDFMNKRRWDMERINALISIQIETVTKMYTQF